MPNNPLKLAKDALDSAITQKKLNEQFVKNLGPAIVDALKPTLDNIAANARLPKQDVVDAISKIKIPPITIPPINVPAPNVIVKSPDIQLPEINVPEANVNVTVPDITIPDIVMPKELDVSGWVGLSGFNRSFVDNPLPVQLRDSDGKPVNLLENLTTLVSGGGGSSGKSDFFTIKGFGQSSFAEIMNADGRLKVSVETGGSGLTDVDVTANTIGLATSAKQLADGHNVTVDNASIRTIQVRGSLKTAYATVSTGTETSLLAATVGSFHDLVYVMGANSSDAAMTVDIRDRTAGSVIMSLEIPANSTAGVAPALPIPQSNVGNAWTVDMGDVSGTNIYITGLFSKET